MISIIRGNISSISKNYLDFLKKIASKNIDETKLIPINTEENISFNDSYEIREVVVVRKNPDKIEVYPNEVKEGDLLVIREFYHPGWKAYIRYTNKTEPVQIYKVGPQFMGVFLKEGTEKVEFYFGLTSIDYLGISISLITFLYLIFRRKSRKSPSEKLEAF